MWITNDYSKKKHGKKTNNIQHCVNNISSIKGSVADRETQFPYTTRVTITTYWGQTESFDQVKAFDDRV